MSARIISVMLFSLIFTACSMGTANLYKVNSREEMFNKAVTKELSKQEPLERIKYPWCGKNTIDFTKYCDGKPAKHLSFYQKISVWGFSNNLIVKFVCGG